MPVVEANPETASEVELCAVTISGVPPSDTVDCATKPVPAIVAVNEPGGNVAGVSDRIAGAG